MQAELADLKSKYSTLQSKTSEGGGGAATEEFKVLRQKLDEETEQKEKIEAKLKG